jgi:hypothetical protein
MGCRDLLPRGHVAATWQQVRKNDTNAVKAIRLLKSIASLLPMQPTDRLTGLHTLARVRYMALMNTAALTVP